MYLAVSCERIRRFRARLQKLWGACGFSTFFLTSWILPRFMVQFRSFLARSMRLVEENPASQTRAAARKKNFEQNSKTCGLRYICTCGLRQKHTVPDKRTARTTLVWCPSGYLKISLAGGRFDMVVMWNFMLNPNLAFLLKHEFENF